MTRIASPVQTITRALPEALREQSDIREVLAGKIHTAGVFTFEDGTRGTFVVSQAEPQQIGGAFTSSQKFFVTRADKILTTGEVLASRKLAGSYDIRIQTDSREVIAKDVEKGIRPFVLQIKLDEPVKAEIRVRADREVIVDGPVEVRLATRGRVVHYPSARS